VTAVANVPHRRRPESCFEPFGVTTTVAPRLPVSTAPCVSRRSPRLNGKGSSSKRRPDCFGPFRVRTDLGASRFGPVYLGRDPSTNARVVIRTFTLSPEWLEFGELSDLLDSFRKLCETTIDHPSLAPPLAFGAEGNIPYIVYSDSAGTAMDAVMRQDGPRPFAEVLQRTRQLADAIEAAASAGVHHGMMVPSDVILDGERTGLTGFGLAQALIKAGVPAEAGVPYGSPQRLAGAPPTRADDIYSLAAITIELLIGTPTDPDQDTRALREAQGLPERRRTQRPAPHETRAFTRIAGVDAGKLRACFAPAFAEAPSERPSTASEFVASLQDAVSTRRVTDEPAASVVVAPSVSDEREEPPSAPALVMERAEDGAPSEPPARTLEPPAPESPARQERVVAEGRAARRRRARARRRERLATSQTLIRESHEQEPRELKPESLPARPVPSKVEGPEPIVGDTLFAEVTPPRASSINDASSRVAVQSGSRTILVAGVVAVSVASFAAGFGGGLLFGQRSRPSTEPMDVSPRESVAAPQPTRAAAEDSKPIASTTQTVAPIPEEKVSSPEPIAAPVARQGTRTTVPARATEATDSTLSTRSARSGQAGSLQVATRPSGAQVFVDDSLIGTTPLLLSNIEAGSKRLRIELSGYKTWATSVRIEPSARSRVSASLEP
jgi:serine/threonine protein kinase